MKKIKKVLAMIMAMAMIMGLGMTAFAADPVNVTVTNLHENAEVHYIQIIKSDNTTETGWAFTEEGEAFKDSFGSAVDDQDLIWGLLKYQTPDLQIPASAGANPITITAANLENAFGKVTPTKLAVVKGTTATFPVSDAGVYAVKATETDNYSYSPMGAYVAFEYGTNGTISGLDDNVTINAKKTENKPSKTTDETDEVVAVGKEVTYYIDTLVPYIDLSVSNVKYTITDTIHGANYNVETEGANVGKLKVTYKVGDEAEQTTYVDVTVPDDVGSEYQDYETHQTFTLDLSEIATDRTNANKKLHIEYTAIVKELTVANEVIPDNGINEFDPAINELYTGTITMTKFGESSETLSGAGFNVYYSDDNSVKYWAVVDEVSEGAYKVTGWTTDEEEAGEIFTGTTGTVTLAGLDDSVTYYFKEKTAPEGYSVNTTDEDAEWNIESPANNKVGTVSMTDTKLSSLPLPGTGGIGTTIFTIGGIVIMVAAAGLYFANRRKNNAE